MNNYDELRQAAEAILAKGAEECGGAVCLCETCDAARDTITLLDENAALRAACDALVAEMAGYGCAICRIDEGRHLEDCPVAMAEKALGDAS